jgi:hypothetical protein
VPGHIGERDATVLLRSDDSARDRGTLRARTGGAETYPLPVCRSKAQRPILADGSGLLADGSGLDPGSCNLIRSQHPFWPLSQLLRRTFIGSTLMARSVGGTAATSAADARRPVIRRNVARLHVLSLYTMP